jgi:hypothetical protein
VLAPVVEVVFEVAARAFFLSRTLGNCTFALSQVSQWRMAHTASVHVLQFCPRAVSTLGCFLTLSTWQIFGVTCITQLSPRVFRGLENMVKGCA